jgi:hypothetical protein
MSHNTDAELDEFFQVRAELWAAIIDTRDSLTQQRDRDTIERFAGDLIAAACQWRTLAVTADPVCRAVLLTDADRYETTAMELRAA